MVYILSIHMVHGLYSLWLSSHQHNNSQIVYDRSSLAECKLLSFQLELNKKVLNLNLYLLLQWFSFSRILVPAWSTATTRDSWFHQYLDSLLSLFKSVSQNTLWRFKGVETNPSRTFTARTWASFTDSFLVGLLWLERTFCKPILKVLQHFWQFTFDIW